jgi:uncharacterized protein
MVTMVGRVLAPGEGLGRSLFLSAPLSFWGGVDPGDARIVERRHPQFGESLHDRVVVMEGGKGSSSGSSIVAEMVRIGTAPAGIVLGRADPILAVGSLVAAELYGVHLPVVLVTSDGVTALEGVDDIQISGDGTVTGT